MLQIAEAQTQASMQESVMDQAIMRSMLELSRSINGHRNVDLADKLKNLIAFSLENGMYPETICGIWSDLHGNPIHEQAIKGYIAGSISSADVPLPVVDMNLLQLLASRERDIEASALTAEMMIDPAVVPKNIGLDPELAQKIWARLNEAERIKRMMITPHPSSL